MIKRRRTAVLGVFAVVASVFLLPAGPAKAATFDNACTNSLIPTQSSLIPVTMTATTSPNPVAPGGTVTLSNINQQAGRALSGLRRRLQRRRSDDRDQHHPPHQHPHGDRGHEHGRGQPGHQQRRLTTATTVIADPDGIVGSGDETATPGTVNVTYADQTWTAGVERHDRFPRENGDATRRRATHRPTRRPGGSSSTPWWLASSMSSSAAAPVRWSSRRHRARSCSPIRRCRSRARRSRRRRRTSRSTTSRMAEGNSGQTASTSRSRSRPPGRAGDGRFRDRKRHGDRAERLHGQLGDGDLRPRRHHADGDRAGQRRHHGGAERDVQREPHERHRQRDDHRRPRGRHDRQR